MVWGQILARRPGSVNQQIINPFTADSYRPEAPGAWLIPQYLKQKIDVVGHLGDRLAELRYLAAGVQYRRMIPAAEIAADLRQRQLRQLLGQSHRDLPRPRDRTRALLRVHVRNPDLVVVGDRLLDVLDRDLAVLDGQQVAKRVLGHRQRDFLPMEARVREHPLQRALELPHVRADVLSDEESDLLVELHAGLRGFRQQDRDAHLELRRLQRDRQSPAETRNQPFLDARDLLRVGVAGNHHLLARFDQRVEQVEELLLRAALAVEKLDVVDQQKVERPVIALEIVERLVLVGANDIGHVGLGMDVADLRGRIVGEDLVADRLDKMRLAEPDAAVDEQRVVRGRIVGDLHARGACQLVGLARDESRERERGIDAGLLAAAGRRRARIRRNRGDRRRRRPLGPLGDNESQSQRASDRDRGKLLDAAGEALLDPLQHKAIGGDQPQLVTGDFQPQRTNPRIELLLRQLLLERFQTGLPEYGRGHGG